MKGKILVLLAAIVIAASAAESGTDKTIEKNEEGIPIPPTIIPHNITTVTPPPSTTKSSTTITTPKTTTKPNTTTTATTTTSTPKTTTSTTTASTTTASTTTAKPPTPKPTPKPEPPTTGTWVANYTNSNRTCLVVQMAIQIDLHLPKSNETLKINVPKNASSSGNCDLSKDSESIMINWINGQYLELVYRENKTLYELANVTVKLNITQPTAMVLVLTNSTSEFSTPVANSYKCKKQQTLALTNSDGAHATLIISDVQFEAFRNVTGHQFSSAKDCEGSSTSDVVPIATGCVLVVMIILILVGYLFGRRRCQARGYLSM